MSERAKTSGNNIVHHLCAADYHAADAVSNTSLRWFRKSGLHYKAFRDGKIANESTKPQQIGTLTHALILEGKADFVTAPETYPGKGGDKPWSKNATYCKEWEENQTDLVISSSQAAQIRAANATIKAHPLTSNLLSDGQPEVSLFAVCPKTGLQLKCRVDWLRKREIVDLKTARDASTKAFTGAIGRYHYHHQAAFYKYVCGILGLEIGDFYFIALELEPIPMPNVILLSEFDLELATKDLENTLEKVAECQAENKWVGYCGEQPAVVTLPPWVHEGEWAETLDMEG